MFQNGCTQYLAQTSYDFNGMHLTQTLEQVDLNIH